MADQEPQWVNIKLEGFVPDAIKQLANTVETIVGAIKVALNIQIGVLKVLASLVTDLLNAQALIIKAAIATIESALEPLLSDAQLHLLVIPFRKQTSYRLEDPNYYRTWELTDSDEALPEDKAAAKKERDINEQLRQLNFYSGGNQGYLRTIMESLQDVGDDHRPQYDANSAIYAHVWVAGASDIIGILDALLTLEGLFGISLKSNSFVPRNLVRTPQDLILKQIIAPNGQMGTILSWTNPPAETSFPEFSNVRMRLHEIAIIRSTDDKVAVAKNWTDLFGGDQPKVLAKENTKGETNSLTSKNKKSQVIARFRCDGVRSSYLDNWSDFKKDVDYYYSVAFRYGVELPPGVDVFGSTVIDNFSIMDYKLLSSVQKTRFTKSITESSQSVKPDWVATPGVLSLIPDLQFYVLVLQHYLEAMANQLGGSNAALLSYIEFLEGEVRRYEDLVEQISGRIQKLLGLLKTPEAGIFTTSIALESGGTDAFMRELLKRMLDEGDTSAPPFRTGTEFVAGIVLLAGAPNFAQLSAFQTFVELLFGTSSSVKTAFEQAVDSIDAVIKEQTEQLLGPDLQPTTETPVATQSYATFNDAMEPVAADDPDANVPNDP